MTRYLINVVVFLAGLAVVCWVAAGYAGTNSLALAATLLIGAFYLAGAVELQRYQRATTTLSGAVGKLSAAPSSLDDWLAPLHPSLRNTVRLRVEGERAALPGPSLTPYLVGLLVLLGMLGTFLGMVATLKGTGTALESATDLQAIRASLAAPVKGLGFAFGTSIAGVATSAMLGLLSALARRDRIQAGQALDARIATTLRVFSPGHRREEGFRLLQRQTEAMPMLVDRLQAMMTAMEQHSLALNERLASGQEALQGKTEAAYTRLAASFEQALATSAAASANAAGAAIQPAVETTMAGLAREATALHDTVTRAVQQQLDGLSTRFEGSTTAVARIWNEALDAQRQANETQDRNLRASLDGFAATFEQRSASLLEGVAERTDKLLEGVSARTDKLVDGVSTRSTMLMDGISARSDSLLEHVSARSTGVLDQLSSGSTRVLEDLSERSTNVLDGLSTRSASVLQGFSEHSAGLANDYAERQQAAAAAMAQAWDQAMARQESTGRKLTEDNQAALAAAVAAIEQRGTALLQATEQHGTALLQATEQRGAALLQATEQHGTAVLQAAEQRGTDLLQATEQSQARLRGDWAAQEQQRLAAWTESLAAIAAALRSEWQQAGATSAASQREVCDTLARTAQDISAQTQAHASETIAEIERLVQAASEAPKAAADVVAELRQKLSDSMVRDNTMLEERGRLLETLGTLLDAVNHASTEQRQAVDALVSTSADLLDRVGTRFTEQVDTVGGRFTQDVERVGAQFTSDVERVGGELAGNVERVGAELTTNVERVGTELTTNIGRVGTAFTDTVEKVGTAFTDSVEKVGTSFTDSVERVGTSFNESVEKFGAAFTDNVEKVGSRFTDDVDRVGVRFAEEFDRVANRFTEEVDRAGTGFTGQVDAARERFADDVDRAGSRFGDEVASRTSEMAGIAAQVTGSAVEVASLGDAFGAAVKLFSQSNEQLVAHLQRIESVLTRSITRSDEQLAYYVAQAREIVDLSTLSQKQIIENLQSMAGQQAASGTEAS